jgi:hypothetical protein
MNNRERIRALALDGQIDRKPFFFYFGPWPEAVARWKGEGLFRDWREEFGTDAGIEILNANLGYHPAFREEVLEEKSHTRIIRDRLGITQEVRRVGASIPHYIDYPVKCRADWEKLKSRLDPADPGRFPGPLRGPDTGAALQLGAYPYGLFGTLRDMIGVETLLFFNPAVWLISRRIRIERENCCDDLAVAVCGDAVAYARAPAQLESMRSAPLAAAAANGGSLGDRVRRLVRGQSERAFFSNGWTAAASITSFALLLGLASAPLFGGGLADDAVPQTQSQTAGTEVDVKAPPKTPAVAPVPAKPKAKKAHPRHSEFDYDFNFDIPDVPEVPQPPIPPDLPERMHAFAIMAPRIREEVRASMEAALAGMDDNGRRTFDHAAGQAERQ